MTHSSRLCNASTRIALALTLALPALAAAADGEQVYDTHCKSCHGAGTEGAPSLNDRDGWTARSQKGMEVLVRAAIDGVEGYGGRMPPRGGNPKLSDDEVAAAVNYMVNRALGR